MPDHDALIEEQRLRLARHARRKAALQGLAAALVFLSGLAAIGMVLGKLVLALFGGAL